MKLPKLTTSQRVLKRNIEEISELVTANQRTLVALRGHCRKRGHIIVPRVLDIDEQLKTDKWASTGAYCYVCGESVGWWCPKSPNHYCSYEKSRNEDDCDYCHMPMERK